MRRPTTFAFVLAAGTLCSAAGLLVSQVTGAAAEVESPASNTSALPNESAPAQPPSLPFVTEVTPPTEAANESAPAMDATPAAPATTETAEPISTEVAQEVATPTPSPTAAPAMEAAPASTVSTLPDPVQAVVVENLPGKAQGLLDSMNAARLAEGLAPLAVDETLTAVALSRAQDLVTYDYFAHYGPDGGSAFSELAARGVHYALAGENLARNNYVESKTVAAAFEGLMASPGHRANILEPKFTRVGVVAVLDGRMWVYVTVFMS